MVESKINGFKETEIGLIPEDWEVAKIKDIAKLIRGTSWRKDEANKIGEGIPVLTIPNIGWGNITFNFYYFLTKKVSPAKLIKLKDIIFVASSGSLENIGRNAFIKYLPFDEHIGFASFLAVLRVDSESNILPEFLYFLINSQWIDFSKFTKRAADGKYNFQLRDFENNALIPLPPLSEQQKIAKVLDTIQRAIEIQDRIIETTKNLKKFLMQKLFREGTKGEELKETEIGLIPESWEVIEFENAILKRRIKVGKIKQQNYKKTGKYPVIDQGQNFIAGYTDEEDKVYQGPLPVVIFGDHTRIFKFVDFPFVMGADGVKIILPDNNKFYPRCFFYILQNLKMKSRGYNRHYPLLKEKKIPRPPLPEQQEIANILSTVDRKIEIEQRRKDLLKQLFKTMLHKLMNGEIRLKDVEI